MWARRLAWSLLIATLLFAIEVPAQTSLRGAPLLTRYGSDSTGAPPRHFGAAHDRQGRLYVANLEGLLRYDGDRWELLRLPGAVPATTVVRGPDARIYVGGFDVFGVVTEGADGSMGLHRLSGQFPGDRHDTAVANVWQIIVDGNVLHFRTEHAMYTLDPALGAQRSAPLPDTARMFFATRHGLVGRIDGRGLVRMDAAGVLHDLAGGAAFARQGVIAVVEQAGRALVIGDDGFFELGATRVRRLGRLPFELAGDRPNAASVLADDSIVVGTAGGELLRFDRALKPLDRVAINAGTVEDLHIDAENGLWVVGEGELVRLRWPAPWTWFGPAQGVRGSLYDAEWHDDALWLAGTAGLARIASDAGTQASAQVLPWFSYEGYALQSTAVGLLIGHRSGLLLVDRTMRPQPLLADTEAVLWLIPVAGRADRMHAVGERTLWMLARQGAQWRVHASTDLANVSPDKVLAGSTAGDLWLADSRSTFQRWRFDPDTGVLIEKTTYGGAQGVPDARGAELALYALDGRIHTVVDSAMQVLDGDRFVADRSAPASLVERPGELIVRDSPAGTFAATSRELLLRAPGAQRWDRLRFGGTSVRGFSGIHVGSDGLVRIATWNGLLQYDPAQVAAPDPPLAVTLARAEQRLSDGAAITLKRQPGASVPLIAAGATLAFRFGLVTMEGGVDFRYRVHGLMSEWSEWAPERDLILRQPDGGDYSLEVQARTRSGREASPLFYRFRVEPRWTQMVWAKTLAAAAALLVVLALAQAVAWWRTQRFSTANALLESRIAERTRELEVANRKLSELATEDSLTGISNRRALESGMTREWHRCLDQRRPIAALMIDVDHFKRFNDQHGHLEGDALLRRIAQVLRGLHDPTRELLARFGGEEFALILPGTDLEEAQRRAQQLCEQIKTVGVPVTVSIGVAAQVPSPLDDPHLLLRRADAALYRAKRNGRNRVEIAND